jgi:hypothetical protein
MLTLSFSADFKPNKYIKKSHPTEENRSIIVVTKMKAISYNELKKKRITILLLPSANGYDFAMDGYDFNPLIFKELDRYSKIKMLPFPYRVLRDTPYYGIFYKRYAPPILKKVKADYLIFTRFRGPFLLLNGEKRKFGYETKILNTRSMKEKVSIKGEGFSSYSGMLTDILLHIDRLKNDIRELK